MWCVIQTKSGEETDLKNLIDTVIPHELYNDCFVPLFEDVRKKGGVGHIRFRRIFPGYLFIDTSSAEELQGELKRIPRFSKILFMPERDGSKTFLQINESEKAFLSTLLTNGVMRVSHIRTSGKGNRIESIKGPLAVHASRIARLDLSHRMAIVETELLGRKRKIKFGLWTDKDPVLPLFPDEEEINTSQINGLDIDIGIHPGDIIIDETGIYEDVMKVVEVNGRQRTVKAKVQMFGRDVLVVIDADNVSVVEKC